MVLKILRLPAVKATTGLGRSAIYSGMVSGTFPKSVRLGPRTIGWRSEDITAWVESRPLAHPGPAGEK